MPSFENFQKYVFVQEMALVINSYSNLSCILKDVIGIQKMAQMIANDSYSIFLLLLFTLFIFVFHFQDGADFLTFVLYSLYYLSILFLTYLYFNC